MPNGKTISIDVQLDKTKVNDVKQKVMEKSGLRLEDIILVYKEEILRNDYLLKQYGIDKEAKIDAETAETLTKNFKQKLGI